MRIADKYLPDVQLKNIGLEDAYDLRSILGLTSWEAKGNLLKGPAPFATIKTITHIYFYRGSISIGLQHYVIDGSYASYSIFNGSLEEAKNKYPSLFTISGTAY